MAVTHTRELVTPEKAKEYLAANCVNRKIRQDRVRALTRDILGDAWKETHQGIAFDTEGKLIDGQHRLTAIVNANKAVYMDVARGVEHEAGAYVDSGIARRYTDAIVFDGRFNDDPAMRHKETPATLKTLIRLEIPFIRSMSNHEVMTVMEMLSDELHKIYHVATTRSNYSAAAVKAAAMAALMCGESEDDLFHFFSIYCNSDDSDCVGKNTTIVWNWKQQILSAKLHNRSFTQEALYNGTQNAIYNFCRGNNVKTVKLTSERRYNVKPRLIELITKTSGDPTDTKVRK